MESKTNMVQRSLPGQIGFSAAPSSAIAEAAGSKCWFWFMRGYKSTPQYDRLKLLLQIGKSEIACRRSASARPIQL